MYVHGCYTTAGNMKFKVRSYYVCRYRKILKSFERFENACTHVLIAAL